MRMRGERRLPVGTLGAISVCALVSATAAVGQGANVMPKSALESAGA